jgi:putative transposase
VKYAFVVRNQATWPVSVMCRMLVVSRAGFYEWSVRAPSKRSLEDARLMPRIRESFTASDGTYGAVRVARDLRDWGEHCGKRRAGRLMRLACLRARVKRRRRPHDEGLRPEHSIAPNVLDRQFEAEGPNRKWVADFTYLWTAQGWLFLAVVLDLYSRKVVGWSMNANMTAQLVIDALLMAIWRRGKPVELLHHSDQGSQYTCEDFQRFLASQGIVCSMSRKGDCWDNAAIESFFSTLKRERVYRREYRMRDEARADVFDYIERFYNPRRRHSTLGLVSPDAFERATASLG